MKNIEKKVNLISVRVDFRTELLGIIQVLSENPLTKTNEKIGNTSLTLTIIVMRENDKILSTNMVFVSVDNLGQKVKIKGEY